MPKQPMELMSSLVLLACVASCGGDFRNADAPPVATASAGGTGFQTPLVKAVEAQWERIGIEGQWLTVPANSTVRYGSGETYVYKTVSGDFPATNQFFGTDPVRGIRKSVDRLVTGPSGPPPAKPADAVAGNGASNPASPDPAPGNPDKEAASEPRLPPAIFALSGSLQHGAGLRLRGSNFGEGKTAVLLWDDFEGGQDGAPIAPAPAAGTWKRVNHPTRTTYTTAHRHSGRKSLYAPRTPANQWANFDVELPDGTRFYQSFWFRYNYPVGARGQTKIAQLHGTYGVGDFNPGMLTGGFAGNWWATYLTLENTRLYNRGNYPGEPAQNTWHHFEAIYKQSSVGIADGSVTLKVNGQVVYRQDPVKTRELEGHRWYLATFFTGMTNFGGPTETWIDDVYLSDSWARVELCEAAMYAACTRKTVQLATGWSADAIDIRFNQGDFQPGQTAYLYVVDAEGRANANGHPVVIGSQAN